jgi:hypothetical protein
VYARTYIYCTVHHYLLMQPLQHIQIELLLYFAHTLAYDIQNYLLIFFLYKFIEYKDRYMSTLFTRKLDQCLLIILYFIYLYI